MVLGSFHPKLKEDKLVWIDRNVGNYSVKSEYKVLRQVTGKEDNSVHHDDWLRLWKIQAPPKAKHLLWPICRECLPTRMRLQEKHVPCQLSCPLCDQAYEDDWHAIFMCNTSVQARQAAGLDQSLSHHIQQATSMKDLILNVCSAESNESAGIFAMLTWVLWQNRNNKLWNNVQETGRNLGMKARFLWDEWHEIQQVQHGTQHPTQQQQEHRWERPQQGWYKCKIDASFHRGSNKTSAGWVLRDHMGRFVMVKTTWLVENYFVIEGKTIALLEAMKAMEQRRISHGIFETDSKSVVDAIHYFHGGNSEFSLLV